MAKDIMMFYCEGQYANTDYIMITGGERETEGLLREKERKREREREKQSSIHTAVVGVRRKL